MKSLIVALSAVCLFFSNYSAPHTDHSLQYSTSETRTLAESIVMEDDLMMLTTTDSSNGTITQIDVRTLSNVLVNSYPGCSSSTCRTDLSGIASGTYSVEAFTSTGHSFSGTVTIGS